MSRSFSAAPWSIARGHGVGRIEDLVATTGELYPSVRGLVVRMRSGERRLAAIPVGGLRALKKREPVVLDPASFQDLKLDPSDFLIRDLLLDQQIVDVQGAKVERVNDVQLLVTDRIWIVHVDVGFTGLMRRLGFEGASAGSPGMVGREPHDELISWKFVQPLAESEEPGTRSA